MKRILLTGGSRGLGLTIAEHQLKLGNHLLVINRKLSSELAALMKDHPGQVEFIECDLTQTETIDEVVFGGKNRLESPVHGLVNNAGLAYDDLVSNLNLGDLERMFQVNVFSAMMLSKFVIRNMLFHKIRGSLVHVSSISAHTGYSGLAMYSASKGAMESFSRTIAREWGRFGIRSNCLVAGFMETSMTKSLGQDQVDRIRRRTSLGDLTDLDSAANAVDFLLSDSSKSMTGQNVFVDGGVI